MTNSPFFDRERREEDSDPVWRLLARSPLPRPDAWFSARALAGARTARVAMETRRAMVTGAWRWLVGAGLATSMAVFLAGQMTPSAPLFIKGDAGQRNVQEAFEILATMQPDTDTSSTSSWQDSSL